jgi:hypothetical protein
MLRWRPRSKPKLSTPGDRDREAGGLVVDAEVLAQDPAGVERLAQQQARVDADRVGDRGGLRQHRGRADLGVDVGAHAGADVDRALAPQQLGVEAGGGDEAVAEDHADVLDEVGVGAGRVDAEDLKLLIDAEAELAVAALAEGDADVDARGDLPLRWS